MARDLSPTLASALVASSALIALTVLPPWVGVLLGISILLLIGSRYGASLPFVSIGLFGIPFLSIAGNVIGATATQLIIVLDLVMVVVVAMKLSRMANVPKWIIWFLSWWYLLLALYSLQFLLGPGSAYSLYSWQFLFIYGHLAVLTALLTNIDRIHVADVASVGIFLFSYIFVAVDISILEVSEFSHKTLGLRITEGFDPISMPRAAGMLSVFAIAVYLLGRRRPDSLGQILATTSLAIPVVFFSYTRQVYLALAFTIAAIFVYSIARRKEVRKSVAQGLTMIGFFVCVVVAIYYAYQLLLGSGTSRVIEKGLSGNVRSELWNDGWRVILEQPILGVGVGGFQLQSSFSWPHNWFIEAWVELGFFGLLLSIVPAILIVSRLRITSLDSASVWTFAAMYFLIVVQFSADIPRNFLMVFFTGVLFGIQQSSTTRSSVRRLKPSERQHSRRPFEI